MAEYAPAFNTLLLIVLAVVQAYLSRKTNKVVKAETGRVREVAKESHNALIEAIDEQRLDIVDARTHKFPVTDAELTKRERDDKTE